jgi:hypothetical protein
MVCASSAFFRFSSLISLADSDVTPRRPPGVDLGLRHPPAQRLGAHPQPAGARPDRSELRLVVADMITNQPYRPGPVSASYLLAIRTSFSTWKVCIKPGTVHPEGARR